MALCGGILLKGPSTFGGDGGAGDKNEIISSNCIETVAGACTNSNNQLVI